MTINALIGVHRDGENTFYVKRSAFMTNYPGVWSLPSMKFDPADMPDGGDPDRAKDVFERMAIERFGGVLITVGSYLTSGSSDRNPMGEMVNLHLYDIDFPNGVSLSPRYYTDSAWMTAAQYEAASAGQPCGLCTRLWADYAFLRGITDRPFIATPSAEAQEE